MVPEPVRLPRLNVRAGTAAILLATLALLAWATWRSRDTGQTLHELKDDYAALALGHGINLDYWVEEFPGPRSVGYFQTTHPGIPLQVVSGLLYQVAREPGGTAAERAVATLLRPQRFLEANRIAVLVLLLATCTAVIAATWRGHGLMAFLVPLAVFAYSPAWPYLFDLVGNETFALPLFLALWLAMRKALDPGVGRWPFFLVGALGGLGYLNKMNYVVWLLASGLGIAWFVVRTNAPLQSKVAAMESYLLGAFVSVVGLGTVFLGPDGFGRVLAEHVKVVANTGHFGLGDPGVVNWNLAWSNLQDVAGRDPLFTAWTLAVLGIVAWSVARRWRAGDFPPCAQGMLLFLSASFGLAFLAALKHYFPRYLVPALVVLPFSVLSFGRGLPALAAGALLLGTAGLDIRVALSERDAIWTEREAARAYAMEVEAARALPVAGGMVRVWTYKVRAPEYGISFTTDNAHHRELDQVAYGAAFSRDRGFFRDIPDRVPWEYLVYDREAFLGPEQLPAAIRETSEVVSQGQHLLVLRRKPASSAPHSPR
jgi:hypothetical protein